MTGVDAARGDHAVDRLSEEPSGSERLEAFSDGIWRSPSRC